jgi:lysophospholipase L1-like esterase
MCGAACSGGSDDRGGQGGTGTAGTAAEGGRAGTTGAAGRSGAGGGPGPGGSLGAAGLGASAGESGSSGGGSGGTSGTAGGAGRGGAAAIAGAGGGGGTGGAGGRGGAAGLSGRGGVGGLGGRGGADDGGVPDGASPDGGTDGGAAYNPCPTTAGTACMVLPLGDSITEGYEPSGANGGYRVELFNQAVMAGKNLTFVGTLMNGPNTVANRTFPKRHEGHGGYTISGGGQGAIAGTVTDTAISTYHPNIVLLSIGTNDIDDNIDVSKAPTRLGQLLDEIIADAPNALVVVASIIPIKGDSSQRIQSYNAAIPGLVSARAATGKHVVFADNYAAFVKDASWASSQMADNLHPNDAGYAVLGRGFYGAIAALLPTGP